MVNERPPRHSGGSNPRYAEVDDPRSVEIRAIVLELVASRGYDSLTIDEIAAAARASKATLYRRWPSKAAIVVDAVRHNVRQLQDPGPTGTLRGDLLAVLSVVAEELLRDADLVVELLAAARRDEVLMSTVTSQIRQPGQVIGQLPLERAIARSELPPDTDTHLVADVAMPMLLHRVLWRDPVDSAFAAYVVDDVLLPLLAVAVPANAAGTATQGIARLRSGS